MSTRVPCPSNGCSSATHEYGSNAHRTCVLRAANNRMHLPSTMPEEMLGPPPAGYAPASPRLAAPTPAPASAPVDQDGWQTRGMQYIAMQAPDGSGAVQRSPFVGMRDRAEGCEELDVRNAINDYRLEDNAAFLNQALRDGRDLASLVDEDGYGDDGAYWDEMHRTLQYVADRSITAERLQLWRGVATTTDYVPGQRVSHRSWSSASLERSVGEAFAAAERAYIRPAEGEVATLLEIDLPPGSRIVNTLEADVSEVILPPETEYDVISVEERDGVRHVRLVAVVADSPREGE